MSTTSNHTAVADRPPMERLLRPRSIAIVGASATAGTFGATVLNNLDHANYAGQLFLINPKRANIGDRPCLGSVDELPEKVDCAILAIPRAGVLQAVEACARRKVGGVVVFSAGFAESGEAGRLEQEELGCIAREANMVIEGPNCLGIANYVDRIPLTFVITPMPFACRGKGVAVISQSGAMAAVLGVSLRQHGLDISISVSTGNEAANGVEDFLEYVIDDPHTRVVTMIVELFRDPRRFLAFVRRARLAGKHIVLLHPGTSGAARASAATHTGAMAGDYKVMSTKVKYAGVFLVETLEELVDAAHILYRCDQPPVGGTVVLTESGAYKALALDLAERLDLALPPLATNTAELLRQALPDFIPPANPLDITAHGLVDPDLYRRTLPPILNDPQYDCLVLAIILTDEATSTLKLGPIIKALKSISTKKLILFAGLDEGAAIPATYVNQLREICVPFFPTSERVFRALARISNQAPLAQQERPRPLSPLLHLEHGTIPEFKAKQILQSIGITVPRGELATTLAEAQRIAEQIGYPIALKAQASALSHKSEVGGVALNLKNASELTTAWDEMQAEISRLLPSLQLDGILVEAMGRKGTEMIIGSHNDAQWGPVLLAGFGGIMAEALNDFRLIPPEASRAAIVEEINRLQGSAILRGFRGSPELDVDAVAEVVEKLGQLALSTPSILDVDINPLVVYENGQGAIALDALIVNREPLQIG
jgi:acetate---CoA ligase (ADP-forming)